MPAVSKDQAVELLTKEVERLGADEICEIHDDLFRYGRPNPEPTPGDATLQLQQIVAYLHRGLEPVEVVEVWGIIIPRDRHVWYDEDDGLIHYNEEYSPTFAD